MGLVEWVHAPVAKRSNHLANYGRLVTLYHTHTHYPY